MAFRLKPSQFEAARPILDRVQARGWIWQGRQELDGLCCAKAWFRGKGWIAALTPWLGEASGVEENDDFVLLTFEKPVACDCDRLGRVLPLRRSHGGLTSFPLSLSGGADAAAAMDGQLLLIDAGERSMTALSTFRPVDVAGWWSLDAITAEESVALPLSAFAAKEGVTLSSTPFDPDGSEAGLDGVRERVRRARLSPGRWLRKLLGMVLNNLARIFVWLLILTIVSSLVSAMATGNGDEALGRILVYGFILGLYLLFRPSKKLIGPATGGQGKGGVQGGAGRSSSAIGRACCGGRLGGWSGIRRCGTGVRGKYEQRLRELEKLFEQGRLDEALRRAVALGAESKNPKPEKRGWFGDFPLSGPGLRKDLNIRMRVAEAPAYGIMTEGGFEAIRELYRKQAEALAERGDFERAAFIYAELLNDPMSAVRMFERKGDFETAAKLAQGRRLEPGVFIPLWYQAGDKQRALRLAAQFDVFADLLRRVPETDPFHKELVEAWAQRLIQTGHHARALAITEKYADMAPRRRLWMVEALERDIADPVLIARAMKCIPAAGRKQIQALFDRLLAREGPDHAADRARVAECLGTRSFEKAATDEQFHGRYLPLIALPLLRRLLDDDVEHGMDKARRDAAMTLAESAGQLALRVDLRRLNRLQPPAAPKPVRSIVLGALPDPAPVRDIACLPGNRLLIAYEAGPICLTARDRRRLWSDHIHHVTGLVPIGPGNRIIVVRQEIEGSALSLLDLDDRTHKDIGFFAVTAFSRYATEIGWPVFGGGRVSMLDTASLIQAARKGGGALEHHWQIPMTEPGRLCAFRSAMNDVTFLYHREAGGLVELWSLLKSSLQVSCRFIVQGGRGPIPEMETYGWQGGSYFHARAENGERIDTLMLPTQDYSLENERRLLAERKSWLLPGQTLAAPGPVATPLVFCSERTGAKPGSVPSTKAEAQGRGVSWFAATSQLPHQMFSAQFPNAKSVITRVQADSTIAAACDDLGRILVLDFDRQQILFRNDSV